MHRNPEPKGMNMKDDRLTMAHIGYDGSGLAVGDRVELHPGCDRWMMGDRYGELRNITPKYCVVITDRGSLLRLPASRLRVI
jgi:hypothetical protein